MRWVPLESNPDVMNKYLGAMGVPETWKITDVYGLDAELLAMVPKPVLAVILLFPIDEKYEEFRKKEDQELTEKGQDLSNNIFYVKQFISNSCGTMALIHSVANNTDSIPLSDGYLKKFIDETKSLDPEARGQTLLNVDDIANLHENLAQEGQSRAPDASEEVNHHFIAFVHRDGGLYELDGSRSFPIRRGSTTKDSLLQDAAKECQKFIERKPDDVSFTIVALGAADN